MAEGIGRVVGIIAEYDPFHIGHEKHLRLAKEKSGARYAAVVMSPAFTQRGAPALLSSRARAEMALRGGADVVLSLPVNFALREAEGFALGGVSVLSSLKCVDALSFGCESPDIEGLTSVAALLENETDAFKTALREALSGGVSYPEALCAAIRACLPVGEEMIKSPNNMLAISYLRALKRLRSPMEAIPVLREGDYKASGLSPIPSASAVRGAVRRGDLRGAAGAMPFECACVMLKEAAAGRVTRENAADKLALWNLRDADLTALPEGLGERVRACLADAVSLDDLILRVKSKRYSYARIQRELTRALLRLDKNPPLPVCARLLGFRKSALPLLRAIGESGFPLVTRPARRYDPLIREDMRAEEYWRLLCGLPTADSYRQGVVIV